MRNFNALRLKSGALGALLLGCSVAVRAAGETPPRLWANDEEISRCLENFAVPTLTYMFEDSMILQQQFRTKGEAETAKNNVANGLWTLNIVTKGDHPGIYAAAPKSTAPDGPAAPGSIFVLSFENTSTPLSKDSRSRCMFERTGFLANFAYSGSELFSLKCSVRPVDLENDLNCSQDKPLTPSTIEEIPAGKLEKLSIGRPAIQQAFLRALDGLGALRSAQLPPLKPLRISSAQFD